MTELEEIERDYAAGKFAQILKDLEQFVRAHRASILKLKEQMQLNSKKSVEDEVVLKWYIMRIRSINPTDEIRAQMQEIEREIWVRGETLGREPNRKVIAREWVERHAPGWRDHRVMAIAYCVKRHGEALVKVLREEPPSA